VKRVDLGFVPFSVIYVIPALAAWTLHLGGAAPWLVPVVVFGLIPLLDLLIGKDATNPPPDAPSDRLPYRALLYLYVPVQLALLVFGAHRIAAGAVPLAATAIAVGVSNGALGITVAHELIHRRSKVERGLGVLLLASVSYAHFRIEHVQGHHAHVGTPHDPATAPAGQSAYRFWWQSVTGGLAGAWAIEGRRLTRLGHSRLHPRNRMIGYAVLFAATVAACGLLGGPRVAAYFLIQSLVAFSLLELVNYIEHYGLVRRETENGRFERVSVAHSWNVTSRLTNYLLINLQRHADHHTAPQKRYELLHHIPESPQLPTGYAGMVVVALIPPLWFRLMNRTGAS
jgi:alkane 1-monooxygenase